MRGGGSWREGCEGPVDNMASGVKRGRTGEEEEDQRITRPCMFEQRLDQGGVGTCTVHAVLQCVSDQLLYKYDKVIDLYANAIILSTLCKAWKGVDAVEKILSQIIQKQDPKDDKSLSLQLMIKGADAVVTWVTLGITYAKIESFDGLYQLVQRPRPSRAGLAVIVVKTDEKDHVLHAVATSVSAWERPVEDGGHKYVVAHNSWGSKKPNLDVKKQGTPVNPKSVHSEATYFHHLEMDVTIMHEYDSSQDRLLEKQPEFTERHLSSERLALDRQSQNTAAEARVQAEEAAAAIAAASAVASAAAAAAVAVAKAVATAEQRYDRARRTAQKELVRELCDIMTDKDMLSRLQPHIQGLVCNDLTKVDFGACNIDWNTAGGLESAAVMATAMAYSSSLHTADLTGCDMSVQVFRKLVEEGMAKNKSLSQLILAENKKMLSGTGGEVTCAVLAKVLAASTSLEKLDCGGCDISAKGLEILAEGVANSKSLTELILQKNKNMLRGDSGLKACQTLAWALAKCPTIQTLDLGGCNIRAKNLQDLAKDGLAKSNSLTKFLLSNNQGKKEKERIDSSHSFKSNVELVFENAMKYNPVDHEVYKYAQELKQFFWTIWEKELEEDGLAGKKMDRFMQEDPQVAES